MADTTKQDAIIKKYFGLIDAQMKGAFKAYYYGDPIVVPASNLPALIISRTMTNAGYASNAEDEHKMQLRFTVVTDIRKDITNDTTLAPGLASLYYLIEGRDENTLQLLPNTLMYVLRHYVDTFQAAQLYTDISTPSHVDYGMTINKRAADTWALEASITIIASLVQLR